MCETDFEGKVVLVTGGTSGIGFAAAVAFAMRGAKRVIVCGRHPEKWKQVEPMARDLPVEYSRCDVRVESEVESLVKGIFAKHGRLDICCNNAGVFPDPGGMLNDFSFDSMGNSSAVLYTLGPQCRSGQTSSSSSYCEHPIATTVFGIMYCLKWEIKLALEHKAPMVIVNTAAAAAKVPTTLSPLYGACYAFVVSLTKATARQTATLASGGAAPLIRINCVSPASIDTPLIAAGDRKYFVSRVPLGRTGRTDEVAEVIVWLASDKASFVTGADYAVDGGATS